MSQLEDIRRGSVPALARLIRDLDDGCPQAEQLLRALFRYSSNSRILGITGLAGAGKSTLISLLIGHYRQQKKSVGVISIDPTSPFSGGAILGDRIRMQEHNRDPEVFIKSVATRGGSGGLSRSVIDIVHALEAAGKDIILIETVGVGQDEVDIFKIVQQVLVVLAPGLGDDIQAIKAGVLEIADIFVVNKADLPGAERTAQELREAAEDGRQGAIKPIVLTDAIHGTGMQELHKNVEAGFAKLQDPSQKETRLAQRFRYEIEIKVRDRLLEIVRQAFEKNKDFKMVLERVNKREIDPFAAVHEVMQRISLKGAFK